MHQMLILLFLFSDEKLCNFDRSKSLPFPLDYNTEGLNPISEVIADQLKHDPNWARKEYSGSDLIEAILTALSDKKLDWPEDFNLVSSKDWVEKMKIHPSFYKNHAKNAKEMKKYEYVLLELTANFLKRTINLVPIFDEDQKLRFEPSGLVNSTQELYIAYCNKLERNNFFVSVIPKPKLPGADTELLTRIECLEKQNEYQKKEINDLKRSLSKIENRRKKKCLIS